MIFYELIHSLVLINHESFKTTT